MDGVTPRFFFAILAPVSDMRMRAASATNGQEAAGGRSGETVPAIDLSPVALMMLAGGLAGQGGFTPFGGYSPLFGGASPFFGGLNPGLGGLPFVSALPFGGGLGPPGGGFGVVPFLAGAPFFGGMNPYFGGNPFFGGLNPLFAGSPFFGACGPGGSVGPCGPCGPGVGPRPWTPPWHEPVPEPPPPRLNPRPRPTPRPRPEPVDRPPVEPRPPQPPVPGTTGTTGLSRLGSFAGHVGGPQVIDASRCRDGHPQTSPSAHDVQQVKTTVTRVFAEHGLPPELALAMGEAESNYQTGHVPSDDPTFGIFQNRREDVQYLASKGLVRGLEGRDVTRLLQDPEFGAHVAADMIQLRMSGIDLPRRMSLEEAVGTHAAGNGWMEGRAGSVQWKNEYVGKINGNLDHIARNPDFVRNGAGGPDQPIPDVPGTGGHRVSEYMSRGW